MVMIWLKSIQEGCEQEDSREAAEKQSAQKQKISLQRKTLEREKQFVEEGLPQVLKHQMEKQLNQVQENRLVISFSLKIFIKTLKK